MDQGKIGKSRNIAGKAMKNIGMVLASRFPPDIRVEKEARALIAAGYKVYLLTEPLEDGVMQEEIDGIIVWRTLPITSANPLKRKINSLRFYLSFHNEFWRREMENFVDDFKIDVLHIHDLPLVGTGITVAKVKGIPIIADLHENYPAGLTVWRGTKQSLKGMIVNKLFYGLNRWIAYEKRCVQKANRVIVVVDEARERILRYGIPDEKVAVLMNVEDVDYFGNCNLDPAILSGYRDKETFIVSYIGGFGAHRGLNTTVDAIAYAREKIPSIKLLLIGAQGGGGYAQILLELVKERGLEDSVEIIGWQPFERVSSYIQASDVCLVPHHRNPHTDSTIPHKLFQYMLMSKPVIVSDCRPLKRIVEETESGLVFRAGDALDLADKIVFLYQNEDSQERCGQRGREAVLDRYNWEKESQKLLALYEKLA